MFIVAMHECLFYNKYVTLPALQICLSMSTSTALIYVGLLDSFDCGKKFNFFANSLLSKVQSYTV